MERPSTLHVDKPWGRVPLRDTAQPGSGSAGLDVLRDRGVVPKPPAIPSERR